MCDVDMTPRFGYFLLNLGKDAESVMKIDYLKSSGISVVWVGNVYHISSLSFVIITAFKLREDTTSIPGWSAGVTVVGC